MKITKIVTGYLEENCYLIENNNKLLVVDPGDEAEKIKSHIGNLDIEAILITHSHFDHIGALKDLLAVDNYLVINSNTKESQIELPNFKFEIIKTPGHSSDSVSYYFPKEKMIFVGDFIFKNSIGRTDLETGDSKMMRKSLNLIKTFPKDIIIYPGHFEQTTLDFELKNNPFL